MATEFTWQGQFGISICLSASLSPLWFCVWRFPIFLKGQPDRLMAIQVSFQLVLVKAPRKDVLGLLCSQLAVNSFSLILHCFLRCHCHVSRHWQSLFVSLRGVYEGWDVLLQHTWWWVFGLHFKEWFLQMCTFSSKRYCTFPIPSKLIIWNVLYFLRSLSFFCQ